MKSDGFDINILADIQLSKADGSSQRFFSMSSQIQNSKKLYHETLIKVQKCIFQPMSATYCSE